jgi:ElaB/YqjD/DUF883 family membrane-anchored ribosome-binding protein
MSSRESAPIEGEAITEKTHIFQPENIPDAWKEKYREIRVVWNRGEPYKHTLVGVYEDESGEEIKEKLRPEELVDSVEDPHEFTSMRWTDEELSQNPPLAEAARENSELRAVMYLQQEEIARQGRAHAEMLAAIARYQGQIREFTSQVDELIQQNSRLEQQNQLLEQRIIAVENSTGRRPQTVGIDTTDHWDEAPPITNPPAPEPVVEPAPEHEPIVTEDVPPLRRTAAVATEGEVVEAEILEDETSRWNRLRERLGNAVLGTQVRAQNGMYRLVDRHGNVVTNEEIIDHEIDDRRRVGTGIIIGAVALAGTAIVAWWLAKHTGHSHGEIINNGGIPDDQFNSLVNKINSNTKSVVNDAKNALSTQESKDHTKEMNLLNHLNSHFHNLRDVSVNNIRLSSFNTDSFYGQTPHQAVRNMFDVVRENNIEVHGLTSAKIDRITNAMMQNHWHIASGMRAGNQQNIVDVARDWSDGRTQNWQASGLQGLRLVNGSSAENWNRFMRLASRFGVSFNKA